MTKTTILRATVAAIALFLTACASPAIEEARLLGRSGQHEEAIGKLQSALKDRPDDRQLRIAQIQQRDIAVSDLTAQLQSAIDLRQRDDADALMKRLLLVAPQHPRTAAMKKQVDRMQKLDRQLAEAEKAVAEGHHERAELALRSLLAEDSGHRRARELLGILDGIRASQVLKQSTVRLATSQRPVSLEFHEATLKSVLEALAKAADLNFVFDKDVRTDAKLTLMLKGSTVEEALRVILNTQQLAHKPLNDNTVLIFPSTQQKQRDLLDTVARTFYLTNADVKQAQALVRTVAKTRDIYVDERLGMMVVRDTPEVVRLIERLLEGLDLPDPEVMLELEVLEVSSKSLDQVGINWPDAVNFGVPGETAPVTSSSSMRFYAANPLAIANLKSTRGASNLLANPKIRAKSREKAKVLLGEKLPIFTTTSTANVGVSASVTYLDVGLKLEVEPQVQLDGDVSIKIMLEVSSITDKVSGPQGSIAYQVGTRQATTTLRLRDGETQILAGLINDNESRTSSGLPGLSQLPLAGRLFGNVTDTRDKTEVILLVTPRILRNPVQPTFATMLTPSGTENQPGAPLFALRDDVQVQSQGGRGGAAPQAARSAPEAAQKPVVTGPEEVMPGAEFQISVRNPTSNLLSATLQFDGGAIQCEEAGGSGRVSLMLPPQSARAVPMKVRPEVRHADVLFNLDLGGDAWLVRVREPAAPDGGSTPSEAR